MGILDSWSHDGLHLFTQVALGWVYRECRVAEQGNARARRVARSARGPRGRGLESLRSRSITKSNSVRSMLRVPTVR